MPRVAPGRRSPHTGDAPLIPVIRRTAGPKRTPQMKQRESTYASMMRKGMADKSGVDAMRRTFRAYARRRHYRVDLMAGHRTTAISPYGTRNPWHLPFGVSKFPFPWARYGSR